MRYPDQVDECVCRRNLRRIRGCIQGVAHRHAAARRELAFRTAPAESANLMAAPDKTRNQRPTQITGRSGNEDAVMRRRFQGGSCKMESPTRPGKALVSGRLEHARVRRVLQEAADR
jgi:hypothetical protein